MSSAKMDSRMDGRVLKLSRRIHITLPVGRGPRHFSGLWDAKVAGDFGMRHRTLPNLALVSDIQTIDRPCLLFTLYFPIKSNRRKQAELL
jgi:hypothetical protein